jgi:hypothetical protein
MKAFVGLGATDTAAFVGSIAFEPRWPDIETRTELVAYAAVLTMLTAVSQRNAASFCSPTALLLSIYS